MGQENPLTSSPSPVLPRASITRQDEQVGDGTTSVIVLAGEYLNLAGPLLERQLHPTTICNGYLRALDDAIAVCFPPLLNAASNTSTASHIMRAAGCKIM